MKDSTLVFQARRVAGKVPAFFVALALVVGFTFATAKPALAGTIIGGGSDTVATQIITGGSGTSAGAWIVGGLVVSVASIIACAMIVGSEEGREMTLEEALLSGAIPLGCLLREELGVSE
jgi:peptidoglycan/LPS O-acetylase OafA/YrhL